MIRLARAEDIPRLQELLGQILLVHHHARPDVFKSEGSKFKDADLEAVINDPNKPIFVYEDEEGRILGHLFLMIKEVSDNNGPLKAVKTLFIDDLCVDKEALSGCRHMVSGSISLPSRGSFHLSLTVLLHYRSSGSI